MSPVYLRDSRKRGGCDGGAGGTGGGGSFRQSGCVAQLYIPGSLQTVFLPWPPSIRLMDMYHVAVR